MIPLRLELKNFMSYGDQVMPLDFRGMHLACLSGDNGHGKSAILDAITWVLWGEARASADELVRLGTEEMRVTFDFELGGDAYRVIRGRSKRNSGNLWEIYLSSPDGDFRPLTGQGIRDTAKVIQRILRMDYKTFINSAYIQQGKADEFTKQTVADRKKILADILNLSRYDTLEQRSKDRRNDAEQRAQVLEREIGQIESELSGEEGIRTQLDTAKNERTQVESEIAQVESTLRELQAREMELQATANRVREMQKQAADWRTEVERLQSQKAEQELRVARAREIVNDRENILVGIDKLRTTRELIGSFDRRLEELRSLEHQKSSLEQAILVEKHKLDIQQQSLAKELSELEGKISGASCIEKDAAELRKQVEELEVLETQRKQLQDNFTLKSDQFAQFKAQYEQAQKQKPEIEEKLQMISEPGAKCPLCKTELGHEKHESVVADYRKQIADTERLILELKKSGAEAKSQRDAAQKEMESLDARMKAGLEVRRRLAQAEQMIFAADEYRKQIPGLQSKLESVRTILLSEGYAQESRTKLANTQARITALEYDGDSHRRLKDELANLLKFESLSVKLQNAEESLPMDESNLRSIVELISAREHSIAECRQSIESLSKSLEEFQGVTSEITKISASLLVLRENDRQITGRIATLEHSLQRCESLREAVAQKCKSLEQAKKDKAIYTDLVAAFGKRGVQALIIENAIPEIQDEANRLLARMTDNAMQVSIETIRDKKTGGTSETLDIRISDDMGTRSYELYSGGEAFRVNFALRIALSKLLARRAGAKLQTLVIDEGFGTQDAKGREKLVEAIDSIKDDFEKILVITHIDELKDAFPARIEVTKDESGSHISVD